MNSEIFIIFSLVLFEIHSAPSDQEITNYSYNWNWNFSPGPCCEEQFNTSVPECKEVVEEPEIYWKDYHGPPLPAKAVSAGVSYKDGKAVSVYVGQVLVLVKDAGLQPVGIYNDSAFVTNTYSKNIVLSKNIKVLCTNVPQDKLDQFLKWVPSEEAHKLNPESDLVVTGFEGQYPIYSGRFSKGRELIVGKVVRNNRNFRFYYPQGDGETREDTNFDVLVYAK